jgi:hypothetical protein
MCVAMLWTDFEVLSSVRIATVMRKLMDGRKNKRAPTRDTSRQIPIGEPRPDLRPILLMILFRDAVIRFARSRKILRPKPVRQLPTETFRKFDSELMNAWWTQAVREAFVSVPGRITAHSHRSGSSTSAFKLRVPVPIRCQISDWDTKGDTFYETHYRGNLQCSPHLQRRYFGACLPPQRHAGPSCRTWWFFSSKPRFQRVNYPIDD